jgi:hypothetical protein
VGRQGQHGILARNECDAGDHASQSGVMRTVSPTSSQPAELAVNDAGWIVVEDGFEPGWIYELIYTARDPLVLGLGHHRDSRP